MRYAMIMAGGSGTRLWPMSRNRQPKQLIPFLDGRSLLQLAWNRLEGLLEPEAIYVCAADAHRDAILSALPELSTANFLGEPVGRDTLSAVGLSATIISQRDPDAVFAAVTADHIIGPTDAFQSYVARGFEVVEDSPRTLATFGVTPTAPSTGFGYLELGERLADGVTAVKEFKEKPELPLAEEYFAAGPDRYVWNSGMFVWRADTVLDCIARYEPAVYEGLRRIAEAWGTSSERETITAIYPALRKTSVDFGVMEPAGRDAAVHVVAIPMRLEWLDVGSWPSFARTCPEDEHGNRLHASKALLMDCRGNLVASSDPRHLIAVVGCEGLMVVHTPDATLICPADQAEAIKDVHRQIDERFGPDAL